MKGKHFSNNSTATLAVLAAILIVAICIGIIIFSFSRLFFDKEKDNLSDKPWSYYEDNYEYKSSNLVALSGKLIKKKNKVLWGMMAACYKIDGAPEDKFVMISNGSYDELGYHQVCIAKECLEDPFFDYSVIGAEVYWRKSVTLDVNGSHTYGQAIYVQQAFEAEHEELIKYLRKKANNKEYETSLNGGAGCYRRIDGENQVLVLRLRFSEYENLVWDGEIYSYGDDYYVEYSPMDGSVKFIKLDEELSQKIKACVDTYSSQESGEIPG